MDLTVFLGTIVFVVLIMLGVFFYVIVSGTSSVKRNRGSPEKVKLYVPANIGRNGDAQDR